MRITLVISSLWGGGAERVLSVLANGWAEQRHEVSILTFEEEEGPTHPLRAAIKLRRLGLLRQSHSFSQGLFVNMRRIRVLRRAIRESRPNLVISFMDQTNVLTVLATRGLGVPVIISERTSPRRPKVSRVWATLCRLCYPLADVLVCQTPGGLAGFQALARVRGVAIPNPIAVPDTPTGQKNGRPGLAMVAMGRLIQEKGFDLLLDAFARVAGLHPDWFLTIIGKGPLRSQLEEQSNTLGIGTRVHFAGELTDPFSVLRAADLFVLSSRFEGFPMALAEAMACGLPVVSFDCPEGPHDIVRDGIDGILVPPEDVASLAAVMARLMSDDQERARLAARAPEVTTRFSRERVLRQWQELFSELLAGRGGSI